MTRASERVSFYPIERVAKSLARGGADDGNFDPDILPFQLCDSLAVEDISSLIPEDEFSIFRSALGDSSHASLRSIKYAIVHRFPTMRFDGSGNVIAIETVQIEESRSLVRNTAACVRLIHPGIWARRISFAPPSA